MKNKYICDECGLEMSEQEYQNMDDVLCPECGGKILQPEPDNHNVKADPPPAIDSMQQYPPGQGKGSPIPPEIKGWNWGAFLMNVIWGLGNGVYWQALLTIVPVVGTVMVFVLGAKGNKWAWQARPWDSIEHFKRVQRKWAIAGLLASLLLFMLIIASVVLPTYMSM